LNIEFKKKKPETIASFIDKLSTNYGQGLLALVFSCYPRFPVARSAYLPDAIILYAVIETTSKSYIVIDQRFRLGLHSGSKSTLCNAGRLILRH